MSSQERDPLWRRPPPLQGQPYPPLAPDPGYVQFTTTTGTSSFTTPAPPVFSGTAPNTQWVTQTGVGVSGGTYTIHYGTGADAGWRTYQGTTFTGVSTQPLYTPAPPTWLDSFNQNHISEHKSDESLCSIIGCNTQRKAWPDRIYNYCFDHMEEFYAACGYPSDPRTIEQKAAALEKSRELIKEWLSEVEYEALEKRGELEIPSRLERDVIYIVKKLEYSRVAKRIVKRFAACLVYARDSVTEIESYCSQPVSPSLPLYDDILSKILLLKADEKMFERESNKTVLVAPVAR